MLSTLDEGTMIRVLSMLGRSRTLDASFGGGQVGLIAAYILILCRSCASLHNHYDGTFSRYKRALLVSESMRTLWPTVGEMRRCLMPAVLAATVRHAQGTHSAICLALRAGDHVYSVDEQVKPLYYKHASL